MMQLLKSFKRIAFWLFPALGLLTVWAWLGSQAEHALISGPEVQVEELYARRVVFYIMAAPVIGIMLLFDREMKKKLNGKKPRLKHRLLEAGVCLVASASVFSLTLLALKLLPSF